MNNLTKRPTPRNYGSSEVMLRGWRNNYPINEILYSSFHEVHFEAWLASTMQHYQTCLYFQGLIQESITFPFSSIFFFWTLTKASACLPWNSGLLYCFSECPSIFIVQTVADFHCWLCQDLLTLKMHGFLFSSSDLSLPGSCKYLQFTWPIIFLWN